MTNQYQTNAYLDIFALDQQFKEAQKEQERQAIKCIVEAKKSKIEAEKTALRAKLEKRKAKMKDFAGKTVVSSFKEGLTGKVAEAAERHLTSKKFEPDLKNPIK